MAVKLERGHKMDNSNGDIPKTGSSQWKKNEKIINSNPVLKQARDIQQGLEKPAKHYKNSSGQWHGGKGSAPRVNTQSQQWRDNWDRIFGGDRKNVNHRDKDDE